ncbi:MAG: hypothetical protein K4H23_04840 [Mollicutes bacterium PWAP]|nr:hypothetical protein [Mollicutes bacterium PWAP]
MGYIIIEKHNNKITLTNENGKVSKEWGPRMEHKGSNIYELACKILDTETYKKFFNYEENTNYTIIQPDLFLLDIIKNLK